MRVKFAVPLVDGEANGCGVGWGGLHSSLFPFIIGMIPEAGWHFPGLKILEVLPWVRSVCGVGIWHGGMSPVGKTQK